MTRWQICATSVILLHLRVFTSFHLAVSGKLLDGLQKTPQFNGLRYNIDAIWISLGRYRASLQRSSEVKFQPQKNHQLPAEGAMTAPDSKTSESTENWNIKFQSQLE